MVKVRAIDGVNYFEIASTTVPLHSDITSWLNSLEIPTYDGYEFDIWDLPNGDIKDITGDAEVYSRYSKSGGDTQSVRTYVNGDGDICVNIENLQDDISGSAAVQVYFSKALNTITYNSFDVMEFGDDGGQKTDAHISSNIVSFTDEDCSTHEWYRVGFFDEKGIRIGQSLWDDGLYITRIKFTFSDNTYKVYEVAK